MVIEEYKSEIVKILQAEQELHFSKKVVFFT